MRTSRLLPFGAALAALAGAALAQDAERSAWPRTLDADGFKVTLYSPELEKWNRLRLEERLVVAIEPPGALPTYGVVWFTARTEIDKEQRLVRLDRFELPRASFPSAPEKTDAWLAKLRTAIPDHLKTLDLDPLEFALATLETGAAAKKPVLENAPPRIFLSSRPAVLVLVDGPPALRKAPGTRLMRVVNTRAFLLRDEQIGRYELAVGRRWLEAPALEGPWTFAERVPEGAEDVKAAAAAANEVDFHDDDAEVARLFATDAPPVVYTATEPAELIETPGEPELLPIEGTSLVFVANSDGDVFFNTSTSECYVLVSGRWFRATSRDGPWNYVAPRELPGDFARIPPGSPAAEVLACVPGTEAAREAVIANAIPQTATVKRDQAQLDLSYDGDPSFVPVDGTSLRYAENATAPVLQVEGRFYACSDGVWFDARSATGPWEVADSVPDSVYGIPSSSPLYDVTFVTVYDATPDTVYVGYTPGYLGTCFGDGLVVWGTGWKHHPWINRRWIGRPWTYGFGAGVHWSATRGWGVEFGAGARPPCRPWWEPFVHSRPAFYPIHPNDGVHMKFSNVNVYTDWQRALVQLPIATRPAARTPSAGDAVLADDVYSSPEGLIFRSVASGWERASGAGWEPAPGDAARDAAVGRLLEAERNVRQESVQRARNFGRESPGGSVPRGLRGGAIRR
jgi:hypothetical protein